MKLKNKKAWNLQIVMQRFSTWLKQKRCEHKDWDCDTQIRVIECKKCGKRAWIRDYRSLF